MSILNLSLNTKKNNATLVFIWTFACASCYP